MTRTPRILIVSEMGTNFGHAAIISALARDIAGSDPEGADIVIAARDVSLVRQLVGDGPRIIEGPRAPDTALPPGEQAVNYPDVLRQNGWGDAPGLTDRIIAWSALLDQVRPDVMVTEAAPTALLAARGTSVRTAIIGTGWSVPPRAAPRPAFLHWEEYAQDQLMQREAAVLAVANAALKATGRAPVSAFHQLLDVDATLLTTLPEIDHYDPRARFEPDHPPFVGLFNVGAFGASLSWSDSATFRVFAYLRPGAPVFDHMIKALAALPPTADIIVAAPGAPDDLAGQLAPTPVRLVAGPVDHAPLMADCHLGISHASHGMAAAYVAAGIPQIGLANHTEQAMIAHALWRNNLGLSHIGPVDTETCAALIQGARDEPELAEAAARIAAREAARPKGQAAAAIMALA